MSRRHHFWMILLGYHPALARHATLSPPMDRAPCPALRTIGEGQPRSWAALSLEPPGPLEVCDKT
jgi:hypothetical protein